MPRRTPSPCVVLPTAPGQRPEVGLLGQRRRQRHVRDDLQQLGDRRRGVDDLAGDVAVALDEAVLLPELHPIHAEAVGELVHECLVGERRLHAAEAAHRAARRVVRVDAVRVDRHVRDPVRAHAQQAGVADDGRGGRRVRAAVQQDVRLRVDEGAVGLGAELEGHPGGVPVHVPEERLLAAVAHLHRPAGPQRQQAGVHVHREVLAAAEGTAHPGEGEPHLRGGQAERATDLALVDVQPLGGDEEVDATVLGRHREAGLRAEEGLVLHADLDVDRDDDRRGGLGLAPAQLQVPHQVAAVRVDLRGVVVQRPARVGQRRQHLVVDDDLGRRPTRCLRVVGGHERDRLALVADDAVGEHRLVGVLEADRVLPRHVVGGEDRGHARRLQRLGDVDRPDPRVRVRRPQRRAPDHVVVPEVAGVRELAGDLEDAVGPEGAVADAAGRRGRRGRGGGGGHRFAVRSAARRTASRIFS